jgi:hypothetical protein
MNATRNRKGWIRSRRGALAGVSCLLLGLAARVAPRFQGTPFRLGVPARQLAWVLSAVLFTAAAVLLAFGREAGARLRRPVRQSLRLFATAAAFAAGPDPHRRSPRGRPDPLRAEGLAPGGGSRGSRKERRRTSASLRALRDEGAPGERRKPGVFLGRLTFPPPFGRTRQIATRLKRIHR